MKIVHQIASFKTTFPKKLLLLRGHIPPSDTPCVAQARRPARTHHFWLQKFCPPPTLKIVPPPMKSIMLICRITFDTMIVKCYLSRPIFVLLRHSLCHRPRNCNLSNLCGRCKSLAPEIVSWFLGFRFAEFPLRGISCTSGERLVSASRSFRFAESLAPPAKGSLRSPFASGGLSRLRRSCSRFALDFSRASGARIWVNCLESSLWQRLTAAVVTHFRLELTSHLAHRYVYIDFVTSMKLFHERLKKIIVCLKAAGRVCFSVGV